MTEWQVWFLLVGGFIILVILADALASAIKNYYDVKQAEPEGLDRPSKGESVFRSKGQS